MTYKLLFGIVSLVLILLLSVRPGAAQGPSPDIVAGEILVKFQPHLNAQSAPQIHLMPGAALLQASSRNGWLRLQVEPGREAEMIADLVARSDIQFATRNYRIYALDTPNDPNYGSQWGLHNTGQTGGTPDADIDAPEAWNLYTGSSNITVAVIDTGADLDHPDLQANLVAGYDFVNGDPLPEDDNSHGTHAAGIAAAVGNNGQGVSGVSWGANIMPLKALNAQGSGSLFDLIQAIYYAADNGAKVINMSLGATCDGIDWTSVEEAVDYAVSKQVLLVASSGNTNASTIPCPAGLEGVMAVGATNSFDTRWGGSNYGSALDVTAPGDNIYSTLTGGSYGYRTGTSMAGPHVAGLAALVWSFAPTLSLDEVNTTIFGSSDDLGSPGWDPYFGYGRINAWRALNLVSLQTPTEHTFSMNDETPTVTSSLEVTSANPGTITWTTTITPAVSWLNLSSPSSGTVSANSAPSIISLTASKPITYGTYTTTLVTTGATHTGVALLPRKTEVRLIYGPTYRLYIPFIFRN